MNYNLKKVIILILILGLCSCLSPNETGNINSEGNSVDLRPDISSYGLDIRNQGGRGDCSIFALTFLIEYMSCVENNLRDIDFSEEYLNYAKNLAMNTKTDGGFFFDINLGYQKYGVVEEADLTYQFTFDPNITVSTNLINKGKNSNKLAFVTIKKWDNTVGASDDQISAVKKIIETKIPVAVGMWWPKSYTTTQYSGLNIMSTPTDKIHTFDGHSVDLVGYKDTVTVPGGGYFVFRNHAGETFGDNGYGYVTYEYLRKYANDLVYYASSSK